MPLRLNYMAISHPESQKMATLWALVFIIGVTLASECVEDKRITSGCGPLTVYAKLEKEKLAMTMQRSNNITGDLKMVIGGLRLNCYVGFVGLLCPIALRFPVTVNAESKSIMLSSPARSFSPGGEVTFSTGMTTIYVQIDVTFPKDAGNNFIIELNNGEFTTWEPWSTWFYIAVLFIGAVTVGPCLGITAALVRNHYVKVKAKKAELAAAAKNPQPADPENPPAAGGPATPAGAVTPGVPTTLANAAVPSGTATPVAAPGADPKKPTNEEQKSKSNSEKEIIIDPKPPSEENMDVVVKSKRLPNGQKPKAPEPKPDPNKADSKSQRERAAADNAAKNEPSVEEWDKI